MIDKEKINKAAFWATSLITVTQYKAEYSKEPISAGQKASDEDLIENLQTLIACAFKASEATNE